MSNVDGPTYSCWLITASNNSNVTSLIANGCTAFSHLNACCRCRRGFMGWRCEDKDPFFGLTIDEGQYLQFVLLFALFVLCGLVCCVVQLLFCFVFYLEA